MSLSVAAPSYHLTSTCKVDEVVHNPDRQKSGRLSGEVIVVEFIDYSDTFVDYQCHNCK